LIELHRFQSRRTIEQAFRGPRCELHGPIRCAEREGKPLRLAACYRELDLDGGGVAPARRGPAIGLDARLKDD
jgi:hypothetical protein